jgi:hypothetical protein
VDYFPSIATALLAPDDDEEEEEPIRNTPTQQAWAMMAARLGNKTKRSRFVSSLWYQSRTIPRMSRRGTAWWLCSGHTNGSNPNGRGPKPWRTSGLPKPAWGPSATPEPRVYRDIQQRDRLTTELDERGRAVSVAAARVTAAKEEEAAAKREEADEAAEAERIARDRQRQETEAARTRKADTERTLTERSSEVDRIRTGRRANAERAVETCDVERAKRWQLRANTRRAGRASGHGCARSVRHAKHSPRRSGCSMTVCRCRPSYTNRWSAPAHESGRPSRQ